MNEYGKAGIEIMRNSIGNELVEKWLFKIRYDKNNRIRIK